MDTEAQIHHQEAQEDMMHRQGSEPVDAATQYLTELRGYLRMPIRRFVITAKNPAKYAVYLDGIDHAIPITSYKRFERQETWQEIAHVYCRELVRTWPPEVWKYIMHLLTEIMEDTVL